jgi:hypothetical protein
MITVIPQTIVSYGWRKSEREKYAFMPDTTLLDD